MHTHYTTRYWGHVLVQFPTTSRRTASAVRGNMRDACAQVHHRRLGAKRHVGCYAAQRACRNQPMTLGKPASSLR